MRNFIITMMGLMSFLAHSIEDKQSSPSKKSKATFNIDGYLMLDHDNYSPFYDKNSEEYQHKTEIRRSKIGITVRPDKYIKSKLQIKYARSFDDESKLTLGDAYLRVENRQSMGFQIGHMKEPFGLEQQTSSSELISIERSLPSAVFSPSRSYGIQIDQKDKFYTVAAGYFINRATDEEFALTHFDLSKKKDEDTEAVTMRVTMAPIRNKKTTLHIGSTLSKRWLNGEKIQYKSNAEVNTGDSIVRGPRFYAKQSMIYQMDLALHRKNLLMQAEFFSNTLQQVDDNNWHFSGAYFQASYKIRGDYRYKKGEFKSSNDDKRMAIEGVIRHSYLNLEDNNIGSKTSSSLVGINVHINHHFKIMMNMSTPWVTGDTTNTHQTGRAYSLRAQLRF